MLRRTLLVTGLALVLPALSSWAAIVGVDLGTAAPPATLGGYQMTAFGNDARPDLSMVGGVALPSPYSGQITFSVNLEKRSVPTTWLTWSHGYTGPVYKEIFGAGTFSTAINLPAGTQAFQFYAEPDAFSIIVITAYANDGTTISVPINGLGGANGYGFYTTPDSVLTSVNVSSTGAFAIGEFAINAVPEPTTMVAGALLLLPLGASALRVLRRKRTN